MTQQYQIEYDSIVTTVSNGTELDGYVESLLLNGAIAENIEIAVIGPDVAPTPTSSP